MTMSTHNVTRYDTNITNMCYTINQASYFRTLTTQRLITIAAFSGHCRFLF